MFVFVFTRKLLQLKYLNIFQNLCIVHIVLVNQHQLQTTALSLVLSTVLSNVAEPYSCWRGRGDSRWYPHGNPSSSVPSSVCNSSTIKSTATLRSLLLIYSFRKTTSSLKTTLTHIIHVVTFLRSSYSS